MDPNTRALVMGAAGSGGEKIYVEDVFSTFLYTGNGSTQTITNGIDLAGKGGIVWGKQRGASGNHWLMDASIGGYLLSPNQTRARDSGWGIFPTNSGFSFGLGGDYTTYAYNQSGVTEVSWTFREAAKFFDVVTYTGNGGTQNIAHNLGSAPGCIIIKSTSSATNWIVYHRGVGATQFLQLNQTNAAGTFFDYWNNTAPTSTQFTLGAAAATNTNGENYVAYLFAHDAGGFGDSGNDSVVKCGTFSGTGFVDLGWEPQWLLIKPYNQTWNWEVYDNMRGMGQPAGSSSARSLVPNLSNAEANGSSISFEATGFTQTTFGSSYPCIYIAIRRGPMKTPTDATTVFGLTSSTGDISIGAVQPSSYALPWSRVQDVDMVLGAQQSGNAKNFQIADLVRGFQSSTTQLISTATTPTLSTSNTNAEATTGNFFFQRTGLSGYPDFIQGASSGVQWAAYRFKRAPGFFDVVGYTGVSPGQSNNHNLAVTPDLIIGKARASGGYNDWNVWSPTGAGIPADTFLRLNSTAARNTFGSPSNWTATSTTFKSEDSFSGVTYIAYLFASCPGVSKVGNYTGTGTTLNVDCGFTNGARFVLIKRTDSTGDWYVWDTARGIVSGNDPYLLLNSTAAEVTNTDYIDPLNSGFQISSTAPAAINANGGNFIYLAIA